MWVGGAWVDWGGAGGRPGGPAAVPLPLPLRAPALLVGVEAAPSGRLRPNGAAGHAGRLPARPPGTLPPRTTRPPGAVEEKAAVAAIWQELIASTGVGQADDFFALRGQTTWGLNEGLLARLGRGTSA